MEKLQIRFIDPDHGKIITKTFEGEGALASAIKYLERLNDKVRVV